MLHAPESSIVAGGVIADETQSTGSPSRPRICTSRAVD
jgi:hypothetical protein